MADGKVSLLYLNGSAGGQAEMDCNFKSDLRTGKFDQSVCKHSKRDPVTALCEFYSTNGRCNSFSALKEGFAKIIKIHATRR